MERHLNSEYSVFIHRAITALGLAVTAMSVWLALRYSGQRILDIHSFRETQTALTAFWINRDGLTLAYETPVVGKPWSIPFEFPIYQYLVAEISSLAEIALERTGRLLSYSFLFACLMPAALICKRLFPASWKIPFWIFVSLFMSSPLYLYWGRSFMIETTALLFSLYHVYYSIALIQKDYRTKYFIHAAISLLLALLQKSTTVIPDLVVIGPILLFVSRNYLNFRSAIGWKIVAAYGIPLAIGMAWVHFSDTLKAANIIGAHLTSSALVRWNFGTWDARFGTDLWVNVIWGRMFNQNIAGPLGASIIISSLIVSPRNILVPIILCLSLFLAHFLIFENLHFIHTYYQVSAGIYLIAALAIAIFGLTFRFERLKFVLLPLLLAHVAVNLYRFDRVYLPAEQQRFSSDDPTLLLAKTLREQTDPSRPIVIYGRDWSSDIPFFSERKGIAVPDWFLEPYDIIDNPSKYLGEVPSAIVACGGSRTSELSNRMISSFKPRRIETIADCQIYFSSSSP